MREEDGMAWNRNERRGVGLNRIVRESERLNPFKIYKWVVSG